MSLLDRKLLRDLIALKSQALAVALVMACGLAMMVTTRSLILSLESTRDTYYREHRFADVFARLKRAPNAVREQLAAIPGVATVQTSIAIQVTLDVPGLPEPAVGLLNSLPERGEPVLNRPHVRAGRGQILAVASDKRTPAFPDVPTVAEAGVPGVNIDTWVGLWYPLNTPADIVNRFNAALAKVLARQDVKDKYAVLSGEALFVPQAQYRELLAKEAQVQSALIKNRKITAE